MTKNIGMIDRIIRGLLALAVVGLYLADIISGTLAVIGLVVSGVLLFTSFVSFCPLYLPFGLSTLRKKK